jgi:PAS domain S-box-containing protein
MRSILESILTDAADTALIVDESGTVRFASDQACRLLKYAPGELHGTHVEHLVPVRFRLAHIGHRIRFTDYRHTRPMGAGPALVALCKDGSERPVEISLNPVQRGSETLFVVVMQPRESAMWMRRRGDGEKAAPPDGDRPVGSK